MRKVWITRTQPGADKTAAVVKKMGFIPIVSPLLEIILSANMPALPPQDAGLIFTSQNGVRAFCALTERRHWPVVTVGDATADLARLRGFENVASASGTAADVPALALKKFSISQPIVHCSGRIARGDIAKRLNAAGHHARREVFYDVSAKTTLPIVKDLDFVLLHSPYAAQTLQALAPNLRHVTAISLSEAVDAELTTLAIGERRIANSPTEAALLACLPQ